MQKHTIIILLLLFCFPGIECRAQSSIYFMGNPGDSETILDFIVENDSSAVALMNIRPSQLDQKLAIVRLDTLLNIKKIKRYSQPDYSFSWLNFTNVSNEKIVATFLATDAINFKVYYSVNYFDSTLDTISSIRIGHINVNSWGFSSIFLDHDTLHGLVFYRDSLYNQLNFLVKIDLINKSVLSFKELSFLPNRILTITDFTADSLNKILVLSGIITTDSAQSTYNPCFFTVNSMHQIENAILSPDTVHSSGQVNIKYTGIDELLLGYSKKSNSPFSANYFLAKSNLSFNFSYQKLLSGGFPFFSYATQLSGFNKYIGMVTGRTTIILDSLGNAISTTPHLNNPNYPFSNVPIRGIHRWGERYVLPASFNFGTSSFDATIFLTDSSLLSCDYVSVSLPSTFAQNNFIPVSLQLVDVSHPLAFFPEAYSVDSTTFQLINYCQSTSVDEYFPHQYYTIAPNPATDLIKIQSSEQNDKPGNMIRLSMVDITGRQMKIPSIVSSEDIIDISKFQSGLYLVTITDGESKTQTLKLIKQ